ncbi:MAG TPA: D-alanyl-D-alanine carboxypeptidase, partial [Ignavibacteriaceae bacterium]
SAILNEFVKEFRKKFPGRFGGRLIAIDSCFGNSLPGGYTWEDMGNYYGAGSRQLNWHENQYDLYFNSMKSAEAVLVKVDPEQSQVEFRNFVKSDPSVKGDEIIVYGAPESKIIYLQGKMPVKKSNFIVSGAMPDPAYTFLATLNKLLKEDLDIEIIGREKVAITEVLKRNGPHAYDTVYIHYSPIFDTINYHFLRKSINLYGEALIKTFAYEKLRYGSTESGIEIVRDFFASKGIEKAAINIIDGSGLSPQNRVTTDALVKVLQYAKTRPWFQSFYSALPEYNGMKMKSGSIGGVRVYAGYHKATSGKEYSFSIIVNNFDGSSAEIVRKIYKLLDVLK